MGEPHEGEPLVREPHVGDDAGRLVDMIRGKVYSAGRTMIYGPPGVGKSTWACKAGSLALDYEQGLDAIGPDREPGAATWDSTLALVRDCIATSGYTSLVIDTLDALEDQATKYVCTTHSKKSLAAFGYGDGFELLVSAWRELLAVLETARGAGVEVILVAHHQVKSVADPVVGNHDKFIPQLSRRVWTVAE